MKEEKYNQNESINTPVAPLVSPEPLFGAENLTRHNEFIPTITAVPTDVPLEVFGNRGYIRIYNSGGTRRLYIYDRVNSQWFYSALN